MLRFRGVRVIKRKCFRGLTMNMNKMRVAIALTAFTISCAASAAGVGSITGDFQNTTQGGPWSYGWLDHLGGTFHQYTVPNSISAGGSIDVWHAETPYQYGTPSLWNNASGTVFRTGTAEYLPGWAGFHPGPGNEMSTFRYTAPTTGTYALAFDFQGADVVGTSTDVHIYAGGSDVFSTLINGNENATRKSFSGTVLLNAGQTVDVAVGYASNSLWYDSTAVRGTVTAPVPEPETYAMLLVGLGMVSFGTRRRQRKTAI